MSSSALTIGMLAHVDAGKTSLVEALLVEGGLLPKAGRVDAGNGYLDTDQMEKQRGITIYAQPARLSYKGRDLIFVDSPGHADLAPEMERVLPVLDMAVVVIDGHEGVRAHTRLIWSLLNDYQLPSMVFVNKMDLVDRTEKDLFKEIERDLPGIRGQKRGLVRTGLGKKADQEEWAMQDDQLAESYLAKGQLDLSDFRQSFRSGRTHPVFFGSALYQEGVKDLLEALVSLGPQPLWGEDFSARVYKIGHDPQGQPLVQARITGGKLGVKDNLAGEKVHQIRLYSSDKYQTVNQAEAGDLVSLVGPKKIRANQTFGQAKPIQARIQPILPYKVETDGDFLSLLHAMEDLDAEFPDLSLQAMPGDQALQVRVMGPIFLDVLKERLEEAGVQARFSPQPPLYKETVKSKIKGIGHYEPRGHYAELEILLEPIPAQQELDFVNDLGPEEASPAQVRAVRSGLMDLPIPGVILGRPLTGVRFHLTGLLSSSHSHGGDFREAARRAVRQALMGGESQVLQPLVSLDLTCPQAEGGRVLQDLNRLGADQVETKLSGDQMEVSGLGPATVLYPYLDRIVTGQEGRVRGQAAYAGWGPVEDPSDLPEAKSYDPLQDEDNPPHSIFFIDGKSRQVDWAEVRSFAQLDQVRDRDRKTDNENQVQPRPARVQPGPSSSWVSEEEVEEVFRDTFYANANWKKRERDRAKTRDQEAKEKLDRTQKKEDQPACNFPRTCLLVDGYNILYAWPFYRDLLAIDFDQARSLLTSTLQEYQAMTGDQVILVFDAYRQEGKESVDKQGGIYVVYTQEAQTADAYIQEASLKLARQARLVVATSDRMEQLIVRSRGAQVVSADDLYKEMERARKSTIDHFQETAPPALVNRLGDFLEEDQSKKKKENHLEGENGKN